MSDVAVIGAGYWGPNLVRNIQATPQLDLKALCDLDVTRAQEVLGTKASSFVKSPGLSICFRPVRGNGFGLVEL